MVAGAEHIATWPNSLLPLGIGVSETGDGLQVGLVVGLLLTGVDCSALQVLTIIQGSPASQLMGIGESGQRAPLIEIGDTIVKVRSRGNVIESHLTVTSVQVNSLFVPMQAPDSTISRGPLTLSIRKRSGRTLSVIVERGPSFS